MNSCRLKGTSNNAFVGRIVSSRGARNPHVPGRTLRLLCSGLLTLHPQKCIIRGALKRKSDRLLGSALTRLLLFLSPLVQARGVRFATAQIAPT